MIGKASEELLGQDPDELLGGIFDGQLQLNCN
jgi:hypothetical protein